MEEGSDYYVVRKGDIMAVYKTLNDCQAQICSSVSGPAASAYKGYSWSKEKEEYLSSHGLINAAYMVNAAELREDLFGALVPCTFQEITSSGSSQPTPNQTGILNDIGYQPGAQIVDLNYEARSNPSSHFSPNNFNHIGAVDARPVSKQHMVAILHFDGASKGNPGKAGAGAVLLTEDGRVISRLREGLGIATNNVAEYRGLILGLKYSIKHGFKRIKVYGDSSLVCNQVKGIWQTKNQNMMELCNEVRKLKENFISFEINHVLRVLYIPSLAMNCWLDNLICIVRQHYFLEFRTRFYSQLSNRIRSYGCDDLTPPTSLVHANMHHPIRWVVLHKKGMWVISSQIT